MFAHLLLLAPPTTGRRWLSGGFRAVAAMCLAGLAVTFVPLRAADEEAAPNKAITPPIGVKAVKVIAEVETVEKVTVNSTVDVSLVTLGGEGSKSEKVLTRVRVASIDTVAEEPTPTAEEKTEVDKNGKPVIYERRTVGLYLNQEKQEKIRIASAQGVLRIKVSAAVEKKGMLDEILHNFVANLFQPLLLFFFMGFAIPLLRVPFEFPKALYQSLTIYLLIAIGWHGGELMAGLGASELTVAVGLACIGFVGNGLIGICATYLLRAVSKMRRIDAVTVGAYYGSDSAGTFVTCLGILATLGIFHDAYMPVLLAVMEIPGCLVGLYLVSRLRHQGMDAAGNMPDEPGYEGAAHRDGDHGNHGVGKILHEVFLNPGLYMLFGGILVGFIAGRQAITDPHVVEGPNALFLFIFKGALCLFLLEMGMTACQRLRDLKTAGIGFILFGLLAPNVFATFGILLLHGYSMAIGHEFQLGTYALFAVLCGAASYIAVPAVQRIAIPEASPTLPLAASLGLTFSWNVTMGIPIYIEIAKFVLEKMPIHSA